LRFDSVPLCRNESYMGVESLAADRLEYLEDVDPTALHSHFTDAVEIDGSKNLAWGVAGRSFGNHLEGVEVLLWGLHKSRRVDQDEGLAVAIDFRFNLIDLAARRALAQALFIVSWSSSWDGRGSNIF